MAQYARSQVSFESLRSTTIMPRISERQALIRSILLATEEEMEHYFADFEDDDDYLDDLDDFEEDFFPDDNSDGSAQAHNSSSSSSSSSSTSSTSSTSSSSSSSSSDHPMGDASGSGSSESETAAHQQTLHQYSLILEEVMAQRVLRPSTVKKASQMYLVLIEYKENDPKRFRRNLRVSPTTFDELVSSLEDNEVFHNNSPTAKQLPVEIQLAVALFRFGHDGNAASVESIAQWAGVSAGMVVKATRRVIIATLSIHDKVI